MASADQPGTTSQIPPKPAVPKVSWFDLFSGSVHILFAMAIGYLLVWFPWLGPWDQLYFSNFTREWHAFWVNPFFRGAVSGLGIANWVVAFLDLRDLIRMVNRAAQAEAEHRKEPD